MVQFFLLIFFVRENNYNLINLGGHLLKNNVYYRHIAKGINNDYSYNVTAKNCSC